MRYSEESHAIQATVAGRGVALLSLLLVEEELRQGLLKIVAGPILKGMSYHVLKPGRRPVSEAASTVEGWLTETARPRSEEQTSELQSLMRIPYADFCMQQ